MKKTLRALALGLVLVLALGSLAGCTGKTAESGAETVVLSVMSYNPIPEDTSKVESAINEYIASTYPDANVAVQLKIYSISDYQSKVNLALQSGQQMDLFIPIGFQNYVANNQCLAIDDLLAKYGEDMIASIQQDNGDKAFVPFMKDGVTYGVPVNRVNVLTPVIVYDEDMLTAAGFTADDINTVFDLTEVFAKIKELYPDVYCFSGIMAQDSGIMEVLQHDTSMDYLSDSAVYAGAYLGVAFGGDSTVVNLFETDAFKTYASLMRDWFDNGYLPADMATSSTTGVELLNSGKVFSCLTVSSGTPSVNAAMLANLTGRNIQMKYISTSYYTTADAGYAYAISSTTKVPDAAMKLLNLIYTDSFVYNTILYGIEGEDYVMTDDQHWAYPEGLDQNTVSYTVATSYGLIGSERLSYLQAGNTMEEVLVRLQQNAEATSSPFYGFVFDPANVSNEMTALQNVYAQYMPGLICGSVDTESTIAAFNEALYAAGLEKVIAEKQTQLDAWITTQG